MASDEYDRQRDIAAEGQRAAAYYGRLDKQTADPRTSMPNHITATHMGHPVDAAENRRETAGPIRRAGEPITALDLISTLATITALYGPLPVVCDLCDDPRNLKVCVVDAHESMVWPIKETRGDFPPYKVYLS